MAERSGFVARSRGLAEAGRPFADYAGCKTNWEGKDYRRLDPTAKLSPEHQQRYEAELERMAKERADSIRPK
jgi:hypothetical protein